MRRGVLIGLVASLVVIAAGGVFVSQKFNFTSRKDTEKVNIEPVNSAPSAKEQIDEDNDGAYTNYKHGYSFSYPADKFKDYYAQADEALWLYTQDESERIHLFTKATSDWYSYNNSIYNLKVGEKQVNGRDIATLLSKQDYGSYRRITYTSRTNPDRATEQVVEYVAVWLLHDSIIQIRLFTNVENEYLLPPTKPLFNNMVESFKFFGESQEEPTEKKTGVSVTPAAWKYYKDEKLNISFSYPANMEISKESGSPYYVTVESDTTGMAIGIVESTKNHPFDAYVQNYYQSAQSINYKCPNRIISQLKEIKLLNHKAYEFTETECYSTDSTIYLVLRDKDIFYIALSAKGEKNKRDITIPRQILESMKLDI